MAVKGATGMVLGKFNPPTLGHQYLIDFARHYVERLTVLVGSLQRESIPGAIRVNWLREMFPTVEVLSLTDENPQYPHEHPDFWPIWKASIRRLLPTGPDFVFASEDYGFRLAEELGARYVPVDIARELVPVSATRIREQPMATWNYLPACVRPWFVRKVCILGPESTGKSTLARQLAEHYETVQVGEYARGCIDAHGGALSAEMFSLFLHGQAASEAALARQANRLLFCDTNAFITALYHELYIGTCPGYIWDEANRRTYDLYLLTSPDTPYIVDGQRHHPQARETFFQRCQEWVSSRKTPYAILRGSWDERLQAAVIAVDRLLKDKTSDC